MQEYFGLSGVLLLVSVAFGYVQCTALCTYNTWSQSDLSMFSVPMTVAFKEYA